MNLCRTTLAENRKPFDRGQSVLRSNACSRDFEKTLMLGCGDGPQKPAVDTDAPRFYVVASIELFEIG